MALDTTGSHGGAASVAGVGLGLLAVHFYHLTGEEESTQTFVWGILLPICISVAVVAGGAWLWRRGFGGTREVHVAAATVLGGALLGAITIPLILYQRAEGVVMSDQPYVILNAATVGTLVGFVVGVYDVRRDLAQTRAATARERAEELARQLSVLNRVLRHDIRNRANVIQGRLGLLQEEGVDTAEVRRAREAAEDLVTVGEQAGQIEELLRTDAAPRRVVDVADALDRALEQVRQDYPAVEIDRHEASEAHARVHPLIDATVANVVENAAEHNTADAPRVATSLEERDDRLELRVRDNGPGIPDAEVGVLERGHETALEHASGLGLWLASWTVRQSGGEIRFEENEWGGSDVRIRLEAAESPA